jgi:hypothetical protein
MRLARGSGLPKDGRIRGAQLLFVEGALALALALVALSTLPRAALAQIPPNCTELCGVTCVKPIAIPDRWDDVTAIVGYAGGGKAPNWRGNGVFDQESFTDMNGNGLYDPGEPFDDHNGNGIYDAEAFDPLTTGFVADPTAGNAVAPAGDLGVEITLHPSVQNTPAPGQFLAIDFPPANKGTPIIGSSTYLGNWSSCNASLIEPADRLQLEPGSLSSATNQAMRDLIAQDPNAYWDPTTQSVQGSAFPLSPRVIFVAAYDPRISITSARQTVTVTKLIPVFMEQATGTATVLVRILRVSTSGSACVGPSAGAFFEACATPATRASWGAVKATYR